MSALVGASFALFLASSLVMGIGLLVRARRTREMPEIAIGVTFLAAGCVGYGLHAAIALRAVPPAGLLAARAASLVAMAVGAVAIGLFTHRVFRPSARWPLALRGAFLVALCVGLAGIARDPLAGGIASTDPAAFYGRMLGSGGTYVWTALEAGLYYASMRRRVHLGLGDAVVANRILLWSIAAASAAALSLPYVTARWRGLETLPPAWMAASSLLILLSAIANALVFFPPAAYRRWVAADAARSS